MDCRTFESLLADFEDGKLAPADRRIAENHLAECVSCRCLLEIAKGNLDLMPDDGKQDLTRAIVARTSGSACRRAQEMLCDFADGAVEGDDAELIAQHVEHCSGCKTLAATLLELKEILPQMAEVPLDEHFTASVMAATVGRKSRLHWHARLRLQEWWQQLVQRPRISFEAAYVGTLVVAIFLGNPLPAMRAISVRALEGVSYVVPGGDEKHSPAVLQSAKALAADFSDREQDIRVSLERAHRRGEAAVSATIDYQSRTLRAYWSRGSEAVRGFWQHLWTGNWKRPAQNKRS